jgi:hypothetical protein
MTDAGLVQRRSGSSCDKIVRRHQDRLAIVYVRQSTAQRVERHQESTKLQYARSRTGRRSLAGCASRSSSSTTISDAQARASRDA